MPRHPNAFEILTTRITTEIAARYDPRSGFEAEIIALHRPDASHTDTFFSTLGERLSSREDLLMHEIMTSIAPDLSRLAHSLSALRICDLILPGGQDAHAHSLVEIHLSLLAFVSPVQTDCVTAGMTISGNITPRPGQWFDLLARHLEKLQAYPQDALIPFQVDDDLCLLAPSAQEADTISALLRMTAFDLEDLLDRPIEERPAAVRSLCAEIVPTGDAVMTTAIPAFE